MTANKFGLTRSIGLAILVIALMSIIGNALVLTSLNQLRDATEARSRSRNLVSALEQARTAMLDQETGVRGYLLTGRRGSLQPYERGRRDYDQAMTLLRQLTAGDETQIALLRQTDAAARAWQRDIGAPIAAGTVDGYQRFIETSGAGKARFDFFRARLNQIQQREDASVRRQSVVVARATRLATATLLIAAIVTVLICLGMGLAVTHVVVRPLVRLADVMRRLVQRDTAVTVPSLTQRNEVGAMARAVEVFRRSLIELDRTSVLRATADTIPAMVGYVDTEKRVGFLNEGFAQFFDLGGNDVASAYGRPLPEVFPRNSFPGAADALPRALSGASADFAARLTRQDGMMRDIEATYRPHRAPDGQIMGAVTLLTDVTDRKDIDRRLRHQAHDLQRSNEELEQFAYVASHDLKAPLRGIENLASWIEEDLGDQLAGDVRTNMDLLKSRVRRLESLLDDLLAYSRAGRSDTVVREVDTRALVNELAVLISPPEGFEIAAAPEMPTLHAAQAALAQVFQNLIGNAVKHHPDPAHGHVWVKARRDGDHYEFRVEDDGPGVPAQYRDRVFGMFQTLKPRDEVEGSGMGLAIVKKLVERQTGKVWLGERTGGGLVVHFTWPVIPAFAHAQPTPAKGD